MRKGLKMRGPLQSHGRAQDAEGAWIKQQRKSELPVDFAPGGAPIEQAGGAGSAHGVHLTERLAALEQLVADHCEAVYVGLR